MSIEPVGDDNLISFWHEGKPALDIGFKLSKSDFDALNEHDRKTREVEQNRIIALIKDDESLHSSFCLQKKPLTNCYTCELIALIKGEK